MKQLWLICLLLLAVAADAREQLLPAVLAAADAAGIAVVVRGGGVWSTALSTRLRNNASMLMEPVSSISQKSVTGVTPC